MDSLAVRYPVEGVGPGLSVKGFQELVDFWCISPNFMLQSGVTPP